jgi:hypothetical protein
MYVAHWKSVVSLVAVLTASLMILQILQALVIAAGNGCGGGKSEGSRSSTYRLLLRGEA